MFMTCSPKGEKILISSTDKGLVPPPPPPPSKYTKE